MSDRKRWDLLDLPRLEPVGFAALVPAGHETPPAELSPAARWAALDAWLNPVECYVCPHCGQNAERPGKPFISREAALELLGFDDNDLNRQKDTARTPDQ